jgi:alpha-L-fucosidase
MPFNLTFFLLLLLSIGAGAQTTLTPAPVLPLPTEAQLRWHEMELNAFVHFGINTFTDREWGFGDETPALFQPKALDADQWVKTFRDAGFKGVILTSKHHDGFCLWPSRFTEHSVKNSPYRGDVVREVAEACRRHGLKFGIYVSPWDRNYAHYGRPAYLEYYRNQLRELFAAYGPIFEMWFDGANGGDGYYGGANEKRRIDGSTYYDWPATLQMVRGLEPEVIFFSDAGPGVRWTGNEKGLAGPTNWNTITPDTLFAGQAGIEPLLNSGSPDGTHWIPAEVDVSIRPGWFYHAREDSLVKTPQQLFDIYLTSVGRGSTLLLNVPPDPRGLIHENDRRALREWRRLIDRAFRRNLARNAVVTASSYRGTDPDYAPGRLTDGNPATYWATDDSVATASFVIDLGRPCTVRYFVLQEYIRLGQRVGSFTVETWHDGAWQPAAAGTTIGYKRIVAIGPVRTRKVRVGVQGLKGCPVISEAGVY